MKQKKDVDNIDPEIQQAYIRGKNEAIKEMIENKTNPIHAPNPDQSYGDGDNLHSVFSFRKKVW